LLGRLNHKLLRKGFEALTTAAVLGYKIGGPSLYVSYAGHPPALLRRNREGPWTPVSLLSTHEPSNLPLGTLASTVFEQATVSVEPGDRLAIYTDGLTDCVNEGGEEFGTERLCETLAACDGLELRATKRCLLDTLTRHVGQAPYEDDLTFLLVEISAHYLHLPVPDLASAGAILQV
jgi:sigma-B regulation protein RsbU (phosphoserine phosphatase)